MYVKFDPEIQSVKYLKFDPDTIMTVFHPEIQSNKY